MARLDMLSASTPRTAISGHGPDRAARLGGAFLLLTAGATAVMVFTRVAADADQDTLLESLLAVAENRVMFGISGAARLISGIALGRWQNRFRRCRPRGHRGGALPMAVGRRPQMDCSRLPGHRSGNAVHLGRCRNAPASDSWNGFLSLADCRWDHALHRKS